LCLLVTLKPKLFTDASITERLLFVLLEECSDIRPNSHDAPDLLPRFFRAHARFHFASSFSRSVFETVRIMRRALSNAFSFGIAGHVRRWWLHLIPMVTLLA
jgi:hypothetical protein